MSQGRRVLSFGERGQQRPHQVGSRLRYGVGGAAMRSRASSVHPVGSLDPGPKLRSEALRCPIFGPFVIVRSLRDRLEQHVIFPLLASG